MPDISNGCSYAVTTSPWASVAGKLLSAQLSTTPTSHAIAASTTSCSAMVLLMVPITSSPDLTVTTNRGAVARVADLGSEPPRRRVRPARVTIAGVRRQGPDRRPPRGLRPVFRAGIAAGSARRRRQGAAGRVRPPVDSDRRPTQSAQRCASMTNLIVDPGFRGVFGGGSKFHRHKPKP